MTVSRGSAAHPAFAEAEAALGSFSWRPGVEVTEIPAPQRIAPHAAAISATVSHDGLEVASGRLVLLHDPVGNEAWEGTFRLVSLARGDVDALMVSDPLLPEVGWSWLMEALDVRHAVHEAASGTVTSVASRSFGRMEDDPERSEIEIRASWTPLLDSGHSLAPHLWAWQDLLCLTGGLPTLPEGVAPLPNRGSRRT